MSKFEIKKVPAWVVKYKLLPKDISLALFPYIYLSSDLYENYKTGKLTYQTEAIIAHENEHLLQEQIVGLWKFLFFYIFSNTFCYQEEVRAIKAEMRVYKLHDQQFDTARRAQVLATFRIYHHCVKYEQAKKELDELWDQTQ